MAAKNPTLKQASSTDTEPESGGLDLSFVKPPPDDLVCSICLSVHREPVLTSCCGNHFCFSCVEQVRLERRPCPLCNAPVFTTMLDKYFVRKVNELEVACRYKDRGCGWQGSISALEKHANPKNWRLRVHACGVSSSLWYRFTIFGPGRPSEGVSPEALRVQVLRVRGCLRGHEC